ncbi:MAG TPA: hypothetical protein VGM91_10610 [Conexibacter sp.]
MLSLLGAPLFAVARVGPAGTHSLLRLVHHFFLFHLFFRALGPTGGWFAIIALIAVIYMFATMRRGRLRR